MELNLAKNKFQEIVRLLNHCDTYQFLNWIQQNWHTNNLTVENIKVNEEKDGVEEVMKEIAEEIKMVVPFSGVLPSEVILTPTFGVTKNRKVLCIDSFLYDDEAVELLVENGQIPNNYCTSCGSTDTKPLEFISHSMSTDCIKWLFNAVLPPLGNKTLLDIGSRLGAVLYGCYFYNQQSKIIGIELNEEMCNIQNHIINTKGMTDRILIISGNIFDMSDVFHKTDVIILNNVFQYFADKKINETAWSFIAANAKPGAVIVTIPHLDVTFDQLEIGFKLIDWVEELPLYNPDFDSCKDAAQYLQNLKHYRILKQINLK